MKREIVVPEIPPRSMREAGNLAVDVDVWGCAFVDGAGTRVDPRRVLIGKDGARANGRPVFKPAPFTITFETRRR